MTAIATIVDAAGFGALIQRKGRKAHVASLAPGAAAWVTLCDRDVPADVRTSFWRHSATEQAEARADDLCVHCWRAVALLGAYLETSAVALLSRAERAEGLASRYLDELLGRDADDLATPPPPIELLPVA